MGVAKEVVQNPLQAPIFNNPVTKASKNLIQGAVRPISRLFAGPDIPEPPAPVTPPSLREGNQPSRSTRSTRSNAGRRLAASRSNTLLTGPQGLLTPVNTAKKTLLGV